MAARRILFKDLLDDCFAFLCFFCIAGIAGKAAGTGISRVSYGFYLSGVFIVLLIVRQKAKNIFLFAFLSLSPLVAVIFIKDIVSLTLTAAAVFYSIRKRIYKRFVSGSISRAALPVVCAFICVLINHYANLALPERFFVIIAAAAFMCAILITHLINIDMCLKNLTMGAAQPVKTVVRFNNRVITVFAICLFLTGLLSSLIRLDWLLPYAGGAFIAALRFVITLLGKLLSSTGADKDIQIFNESGELETLIPTGEPHIIFLILERLLIILGYTITIALLIIAIAGGLYALYKRFYAQRRDSNILNESAEDGYIITKENIVFRRLRDIFKSFDKNARIRRLFYKKVIKYLKPKRYDTARTLSQKVSEYEDITELTDMYERARYAE